MASLLRTNADLVASVLVEGDEAPREGSVMGAIAAIRSLSVIVEDTLRGLVDQARAEGRTWADIGEVLHVSRQAAFQRFGGQSGRRIEHEEVGLVAVPDAGEVALSVVRHFLDCEWEQTRAAFDERMLEFCSVGALESVRARVREGGGELLEVGTPSVSLRAGITIVEVLLAFERGDAISQVAINADKQVSGFFIRRADI